MKYWVTFYMNQSKKDTKMAHVWEERFDKLTDAVKYAEGQIDFYGMSRLTKSYGIEQGLSVKAKGWQSEIVGFGEVDKRLAWFCIEVDGSVGCRDF